MKKITALTIHILLFASFASAESVDETENDTITSDWEQGAEMNFDLSQISLSNWASGGENSIALNSHFTSFMNYSGETLGWENSLEVAYGLINREHEDTRKSNDRVEFSSKINRKASERWDYSSLLSFRTQMAQGFDYPNDSIPISDFLSPGYIGLSVGMNYRPYDDYSIYFSPIAGRTTIVRDEELSEKGAFGVTPGKNAKHDFGGLIRVNYKTELMENVSAVSRLELFSDYSRPTQVNMDLTGRLRLDINDYVKANLFIHMIYDHDTMIEIEGEEVGPRLQLKQTFGLGFSFNLL